MSFYNVTNPNSFSVVSDVRKSLTAQAKLARSSAVQKFDILSNGYGNLASNPITAEQLIQGVLFLQPNSGDKNVFLPLAEDLITLLMGPGGFDVSTNDIFSFRVINTNSSAKLTFKVNNTTGQTNTGSDIDVTAGTQRIISLQITISGSTYSYAMF
jgi:hypothetical protein